MNEPRLGLEVSQGTAPVARRVTGSQLRGEACCGSSRRCLEPVLLQQSCAFLVGTGGPGRAATESRPPSREEYVVAEVVAIAAGNRFEAFALEVVFKPSASGGDLRIIAIDCEAGDAGADPGIKVP